MSEMVSRCFSGIGLDLYEKGWDIKPDLLKDEDGERGFADDYINELDWDVLAREGGDHLMVGVEPRFPWQGSGHNKVFKSEQEVREHVAKVLDGKLVDENGDVVPYETILAAVGQVDVGWIELW